MCTNIWVNMGMYMRGQLFAFLSVHIYLFLLFMSQAIDSQQDAICFTSLNIVPNKLN